MAVNRLVILACLAALTSSTLAQDTTSPPAQTSMAAPTKPAYPFLERTFAARLTPEQRHGLGDGAALDKIAHILSPEQKMDLRRQLDAARANASTPDELKEIAQGYLLLNTPGAESGKNVVALAARLQKMEPEKSDGYTIAADGYYLSGDYPAATEQARHAWEVSKHTDQRAWAILKMSEGRTASALGEIAAPKPPSNEFARLDFNIPEKNDVSPQAMTLVQQAIAARRRGDMNGSWTAMQSAMNADPTSSSVQEMYSFARADHAKYVETKDLLVRSREAMDAGRGAEAVELARKAVERSGGDGTVLKILDLTRQQSAELARRQAAAPTAPPSGMPLWPIGAGLGLTAAGYGLYRGSKRTYASEDGHEPAPAQTPEEERNLALGLIAAGGAVLLAVGAAEFGPSALSAARVFVAASGPTAPTMQLAAAGAGGGGAVIDHSLVTAGVKAGLATTAVVGAGEIAINHASSSHPTGSSGSEPQSKSLRLGHHKSPARWEAQMKQRGWTLEQIDEAVQSGRRFTAENKVNPGNKAVRYVHPTTGRSVVIDTVTNEVLQVAGDGFRF